ncbi:hypothetical protein D6833_05660 [Candidatus Parcubacteria bacterium]|nr:MAG: hypothetical protein D6833_05660 [Candidatus Parcubacteria bacterium]
MDRGKAFTGWGAALVFFLAGILFWGGFNTTIELTNRERFCISCHEMRDTVYQEYRKTVHARNRSGVRASCPDCHVPKDWLHMVARKISASNELFHHFSGSISTPEKFRARRFALARIVWRQMQATDSRECRNCHDFDAMDLNTQRDAAARRHREARRQGKTCIDCHKGIAHKLPERFLDEEHDRFQREKVDCRDCHPGMAHAPPGDDWSD